MKKLVLLSLFVAALASCKNQAPLLPNVSGKAGEVMIVIEKADWDGALGEDVRGLLACEYPFLPTVEPMYSLVNVAPGGFLEADMFKIHRNIVYFDIDPSYKRGTVLVKADIWAAPQCVVQVAAPNAAMADSLLKAKSELVLNAIEQAERDRVVRNTLAYENKKIYPTVAAKFGGAVHAPSGYKLRKISSDFAWISQDTQYVTQGIFIYKYPALRSASDFTAENLKAKRDSVLKANVPGMFEGTYMKTSSYWGPFTRFMKYKGESFAESHGLWDVEGDFMGGPYVSHAFYSPDGLSIIVAEAWVYAPKYDKRQYLRQVESLLYSWEWKTKE